MSDTWAEFEDTSDVELHVRAVESGVIYADRPASLRWISRVGYEYRMTQPQPPSRLTWSDGEVSSLWLEWHCVRGLDPYKRRGGYTLPARLRELIIQRDDYVCGLCGVEVEPSDVHIDHIHPRSLGGSDDPMNLQVAHSFCNLSKGAR